MPARSPRPGMHRETGGITILVALMMLVFITITAVAMSRNSFREVVISGTARQGAMARNVADSGVEWTIFWMDDKNMQTPTGAAVNLKDLKTALLKDPTQAGRAWDLMSASYTSPTTYKPYSAGTAVTLPTVTTASGGTITPAFTLGVTAMGKLPITDMSQGVGAGALKLAEGNVSPLAPDLWAFRSDAKVTVGSVTFTHAKELWVSTPVTQ